MRVRFPVTVCVSLAPREAGESRRVPFFGLLATVLSTLGLRAPALAKVCVCPRSHTPARGFGHTLRAAYSSHDSCLSKEDCREMYVHDHTHTLTHSTHVCPDVALWPRTRSIPCPIFVAVPPLTFKRSPNLKTFPSIRKRFPLQCPHKSRIKKTNNPCPQIPNTEILCGFCTMPVFGFRPLQILFPFR